MSKEAKRYLFKKNELGQLSIFLGICMTVILTMLAFIVNVGLFVKAKINLQNAVDAAAWSGAAVQARQLSNIGYMNWELRNTYKEWMFKYYVLGHMGLPRLNYGAVSSASNVDFFLEPFGMDPNDPKDKYNLPSVCIHFGSPNNICKIYDVPGLPRFPTVGLPGISERHESFLSSIRDIKSKDCSERGIINLETTLLWAYGIGSSTFSDLPAVAAHRVGAWIEALEIGFRIRNLEALVNRPPITDGICMGGCANDINTLKSEFELPYNERPIKALISAYRNLGGGSIKDEESDDDNKDFFTRTFRLTEIPPNAYNADPTSLSGLLIPADAAIAGQSAFEKNYLDLLVFPVNMATLYTSFVSKTGAYSGGIASEGACQGTRTAVPVPAYIHSFAKNHEVMTYYSVKGEAKYVGMFFPFTERGGVTLKAYASAKPFGGKIGPRLFSIKNGTTVVPRPGSGPARSTPYVFGIDPAGLSTFEPGELVPYEPTGSGNFWAKLNDSPIGGTPTAGQLQFVIPNLLYDYTNFGDLAIHGAVIGSGMARVKRRSAGASPGDGPLTEEDRGLLNVTQYQLFRGNLVPPTGGILSTTAIDQSIQNVRRPTRYEALNYLIPTMERSGAGNSDLDSNPVVKVLNDGPQKKYHLFAPLIHTDALYKQDSSIQEAAQQFLDANQGAVQAYIDSLQTVAQNIRDNGASLPGGAYADAANAIHNNNPGNYGGDCPSMATKFSFFFKEADEGAGCNGKITPLQKLIREYFAPGGQGTNLQVYGSRFPFNLYYESEYAEDLAPAPGTNDSRAFPTNVELHGAYTPGPRTGAPDDASPFTLPFGGTTIGIMKRNFYSTKFISTAKVVAGGDTTFSFAQNPLYKERGDLGGQDLFGDAPDASDPSSDFKNKLEYSGFLNEFGPATELDF